jgi:hypothetical protein
VEVARQYIGEALDCIIEPVLGEVLLLGNRGGRCSKRNHVTTQEPGVDIPSRTLRAEMKDHGRPSDQEQIARRAQPLINCSQRAEELTPVHGNAFTGL